MAVVVLGALESEIMQVLWDTAPEELSVRQVRETLNRERDDPLAYTTVMTVLARLADKQVLRRSRHGRAFRYAAAVADEAAIAVQDVLRRYGDAAVAHFVAAQNADPEARARLRRLLEEP